METHEYLEECKKAKAELEKKGKSVKGDDNVFEKREMDTLRKLMEEKHNNIKKIFRTLFKNSVIIEDELSFRNGNFYRYRQRYPLGLMDVKNKIFTYANHITTLGDEEKDILEIVLGFITEKDYEDGGYYYRDDDFRDMNNRFKDREAKVNVTIYDYERYEFIIVKGINLSPNGDIDFIDENHYKIDNLGDEAKRILKQNFKTELKELDERNKEEIEKEIERLKKENELLREKCGKYLLVASLNEEGELK